MLKKIRKMLKSQEGFTLVELMIVVVILGILAGIGIQQYSKVQQDAQNRVDEANKKMIESAVSIYQMMNDTPPTSISDLKGYGINNPEEKPWTEWDVTVEANGTVKIAKKQQ